MLYSRFKIGFVTIAMFSSMACREIPESQSTQRAADVKTEKTSLASWPVSNTYLGDIAVYETFDEIKPLFRQQSDTTYVINFWATWCKPCIEELPYFEELNKAESANPVKVVLVSLDFPQHLENKLLPFIEKYQINSRVDVLLDGSYNDWIDKVSPEWSGAIPATYIYKKKEHHLVGIPFESYIDLLNSVQIVK
ncbi:MAG: TlpA family protein disulfide reductase [Flavobacteriaceae bacterium]|nr:TlpA family protein disulfide reductase [Flavobacteriaceae bacterium]